MDQLNIPSIPNYTHHESNDSLKEVLSYFKNHSSIVITKRKGLDTSFIFRETNSNEVVKLIKP